MAKKSTASKLAETAAPIEPNPYCADGCGNRVGSAKSTFLQGHDQRLISDLSTRVTVGEMGAFQRALLCLVEDPKPLDGAFYYVETDDIQDRINTINAAVAARFSIPLADKFASAAMAKWDKSMRQTTAQAEREARRAAKAAARANTESPATKAVFRRLQKSVDGAHDPVGTTFSMEDVLAFKRDAIAYLGDKTDLKTATIESADWMSVYQYFASGLVVADEKPAEDIDDNRRLAAKAEASRIGQEIQNLRGSTVKAKIGRWTYDAVVIGTNQAGKVTAVEYTDKKGDSKTTDRFTLVD